MADLWTIQSNLNRGEVDPSLLGRTDLRSYYNGLEEAVNVVTRPQGGIRKRGGFRAVDVDFIGEGRLESFAFSETDQYLLAFNPGAMYIYRNGVRQININGSGNDFLPLMLPPLMDGMPPRPLTDVQIRNFNYIQTADTIILTEATMPPVLIQRTSDTEWSFSLAPLTDIPQFQFNDNLSPAGQSQIQTIQFNRWSVGDRFRISLEGQLTDEIVFSARSENTAGPNGRIDFLDSPAFQQDIQDAIQRLPNTGTSGVRVVFEDHAADPRLPSGQTVRYVVQVHFEGASANNYNAMSVSPILNLGNESPLTIVLIRDSNPGSSSAEPVWSDVRGWPVSATFHEGRLYFAGTPSLPSTIWASRVADFFNFSNRRNLDDEAITATLDSDQVNIITSIYSNRSLQIFTSGAEFALVTQGAVTPSNFAVAPQSVLGSARIRPISLEGTTLFVQRTGRALIQYVFINEFQAHQSNSVSLLASHLVNNPVEVIVARGSGTVDANYVYLINGDGTVTVYNSLVSEDLAGFSRFEVDGRVASGAIVNDQLHLLVEHPIGGWVIVREDPDSYLDFSVRTRALTGGTTRAIGGLNHLRGEQVAVRGDGSYLGEFTVPASGFLLLEDGYNIIEAGLLFKPRIKTMPLNVPLQNGPNAAAKKKIARVAVRVLDTIGVEVNGQLMLNRESSPDIFGPPPPFTGVKRIFLLGWSQDAQVTITQNVPYHWEILYVALEIKT